jgi:hypothetical protein
MVSNSSLVETPMGIVEMVAKALTVLAVEAHPPQVLPRHKVSVHLLQFNRQSNHLQQQFSRPSSHHRLLFHLPSAQFPRL